MGVTMSAKNIVLGLALGGTAVVGAYIVLTKLGYAGLHLTCPVCGLTCFTSLEALQAHMETHPPETVPGLTITTEDATTAAPISGVLIELHQADSGMYIIGGVTDSNGRVNFSYIPAMRYQILASKAGYDDAQTTVDFPLTTSVILSMSPTGGPPPAQYILGFHVVDYSTGNPLGGVTIFIDGSIKGKTTSAGTFSTTVGAGWHSFRLELTDYYPLEGAILVDENMTLEESLRKIPQGPWPFTAYVIDTLGFPIEGVPIYLDDTLVGYSDREGVLLFSVTTSGSHVVKAVYGAQTIQYHVTVPPDKSAVFIFYRP